MERWENKIAVVTGASSGMGAVFTKDLLKSNILVVGLARRIELMEENRSKLPEEQQSRFYPVKCDITNEEEVKKSFEWIQSKLGGVDILINNAAVMYHENILTMEMKYIKATIDTNIMGNILCTREAFKIMHTYNNSGHIFLINSTAGQKVPPNFGKGNPTTNIYCPTKYSMTALAEIYRQEFSNFDTKIKITTVSPGLTATEMVPEFIRESNVFPKLQPEDVSNCVMYALGTPENLQIREIVVKAVGDLF